MTNDLLYNIVLQMQGQQKVLASINSVQQKTTEMINSIKNQVSTIRLLLLLIK